MAKIDKKLVALAYELFVGYYTKGKAEHYHRGYTIHVVACDNNGTIVLINKRKYSNKKHTDIQIFYSFETCNPNSSVFTQHDTLFEQSTVNTIYRYLYVIYHRKVEHSDVYIDLRPSMMRTNDKRVSLYKDK